LFKSREEQLPDHETFTSYGSTDTKQDRTISLWIMEIVLQNRNEIKENKENKGQFSGTVVGLNKDQDCKTIGRNHL
jgi:hypothetical protein